MIARVAAVLAVGVSSLFATAALAGAATPPPPDFGPPPPPAAVAPPPTDERPWPPAYAPGPHAPTFYSGEHARRAEHEEWTGRRRFAERHEEHGCGLCGSHHGPAPRPIARPCPTACGAAQEEVAVSASFFYGSGGTGPGLEIGGPAGGGYSVGSSGGSVAIANANASASSSASVHIGHKPPPKPKPCGCKKGH